MLFGSSQRRKSGSDSLYRFFLRCKAGRNRGSGHAGAGSVSQERRAGGSQKPVRAATQPEVIQDTAAGGGEFEERRSAALAENRGRSGRSASRSGAERTG